MAGVGGVAGVAELQAAAISSVAALAQMSRVVGRIEESPGPGPNARQAASLSAVRPGSGNNRLSFGVCLATLMRLRLRLLITSVLVAIPISIGVVMALNALRARDAVTTIGRIAESSITQHVRDTCEADPNWFLAGPRGAPPSAAERALPDAEVRLPRP